MRLFGKKILSVFIVLFMFININVAFCANTQQQIKKVEQKRTALRQKINSLAKLEKKQTSIITKNQQKLEKNKKVLIQSQKQLNAKEKNIGKLENNLSSSIKKYKQSNEALSARVRCIYKTKHILILDLLLATNSISQFLDRIYYQNLIIKSDRIKMLKLKEEASKILAIKRQVEIEKHKLSIMIKNQDKEISSIESLIKKNESILEKIKKDKRAYEKSERELAKQSNYLAKVISQTTKNSSVSGVKGNFILPVKGARISSPFGYRIHPIFKSKIFHTGIDYAITYGTPIKASNSGKVIYSGWYGGYGKVVIIDHGSCTGAPTTTLYAHMSRQNVSAGQSVSQGDIIGYVGSTGYSTGPHVHFEVRINGKPQDPNKYLKGK